MDGRPPQPALRFGEAAALRGAMAVCAVTGTKGKTTTATMIDACVAAAGRPRARSTTLGAWRGDEPVGSPGTPGLFSLALQRAAEVAAEVFTVEATSLALLGGFARTFPPDVAVFTNLSRDHVELHGSLEAYLDAKAELFRSLRPGGAMVLNACSPASAEVARAAPAGTRRLAYAASDAAPPCAGWPLELHAAAVRATREGTRVTLDGPLAAPLGGELHLRVPLDVNVDNALAAAVAASALGIAGEAIRRGLEGYAGVPGRLDVLSLKPWVLVDFAHHAAPLERVLRGVRAALDAEGEGGRLTCVFGCGGGRDPEQRPAMGRVAAAHAHRVVVTSDNARGERPEDIADAIERGFAGAPAGGVRERELDRAKAIAMAVRDARPEDAVVIAGKGAEREIHLGRERRPFSDADVARKSLAARAEERP
ncbi:MAG: UDP-N-acetylmuramyl-tripeptide synthetase [Polyangiales bacterium]